MKHVYVASASGTDPLASTSLQGAIDQIIEVDAERRVLADCEIDIVGTHITGAVQDCWRVWHRDDNNVETIFTIHRIKVQ